MTSAEFKTPELATLLGISSRAVHDLAARGIIEKVAPGRFAQDSVARYCATLRETAAGRAATDELAAERLREARERADKVALGNARARHEFVPVEDVRREWTSIARDVRAAMMAVPSRYAADRPHLSPSDIAALDGEIRAALKGLADDAGCSPST